MPESDTKRVGSDPELAERQQLMALCAQAHAEELAAALERLEPLPPAEDMRPPETGLVMMQGRMGGDGAPFNIGEATVSRATVRVGGAHVGHAYHLGRDLAKARAGAVLDALWQDGVKRPSVEAALSPVRTRLAVEARQQAEMTAATRVNFFTMVRGED